MISAETSRSSAYLQALVRHNLIPNYVLVLANPSEKVMPGQVNKTDATSITLQVVEEDKCWSEANYNQYEPIKVILEKNKIPHEISIINNINDSHVIEIIRYRREGFFIYSGYGGVLLKDEILATGKKFLHIHGGFLPNYKGSTTNYYSLIEESTLGATSIFLSKEIDSGPILHRRKFPPPENRLAIDHIYDAAARSKVLVETLKHYVENNKWEFEKEKNTGGETYYIIHPVLKHIAIMEKT